MLNEELGRHRHREECGLCGNECESVSHVLWECVFIFPKMLLKLIKTIFLCII